MTSLFFQLLVILSLLAVAGTGLALGAAAAFLFFGWWGAAAYPFALWAGLQFALALEKLFTVPCAHRRFRAPTPWG